MLSTTIIIFREILEIALILSVLLVATKNIPGRNLWISLGMLAGIFFSGVIAIFAGRISDAFEGSGQEIMNAVVLFAAVLVLGWTIIWMRKHGREITEKMKKVGSKVAEGTLPLYSVAIVIALATLREGAEIVLFMYGIIAAGQYSMVTIASGAMLGLAGGTIIGGLLYLGLIKVSPKHLFSVTAWLLTLVAAGMAAQAASYLIAADMLPPLVDQVWDSSDILADNHVIGEVLHALVGYTARPSAMQLLVYLMTFVTISAVLIKDRIKSKV